MLRWIFWLAGSAIAAVTAAGVLAPLSPSFELVNHFRLYFVAGAVVLVAAGAIVGDRRLTGSALVLVAANVALALPAVTVLKAQRASEHGPGQDIKIATFNLWTSDRIDAIVGYVTAEAPDLVALQEFGPDHEQDLLPRLNTLYRYQSICRQCGIALLAKRPLSDVRIDEHGAWLGAAWTAGDGRAVRIFSVHLSWPFRPEAQQRDVDRLIGALGTDMLGDDRVPVILAGDFNLTPWSFKLSKLSWQGNLRRHGTFAGSWPVFERFSRLGALAAVPLPPAVLIDNVLTSPGIDGVAFDVGPDLGSDHRPVLARVRLRP